MKSPRFWRGRRFVTPVATVHDVTDALIDVGIGMCAVVVVGSAVWAFARWIRG